MAETQNIAKMAEELSKSLFNDFLWKRSGPANSNWLCVEERHACKTHPSDVVFYYENPYSISRTYVNCDLKSYKRNSIRPAQITSAIESLARTVHCAENSTQFQQLFLHDQINAEICGLLFLYNHDGEYDQNFKSLLYEVKPKLSELSRRSKIAIFGPEDIRWLDNVRHDIVLMRGRKQLPPEDQCKFYYPHLRRKANVQLEKANAANLEMLTSSWIILSYTQPGAKERKGYVIYYRRKGDTVIEFSYLIDYLKLYQVIVEDTHVRIKTAFNDKLAPVNFRKAVDAFVEKTGGGSEMRDRLQAVEFSELQQVKSQFSEIIIGMD
jgi:hypothetical protein